LMSACTTCPRYKSRRPQGTRCCGSVDLNTGGYHPSSGTSLSRAALMARSAAVRSLPAGSNGHSVTPGQAPRRSASRTVGRMWSPSGIQQTLPESNSRSRPQGCPSNRLVELPDRIRALSPWGQGLVMRGWVYAVTDRPEIAESGAKRSGS
jgi:hypothetical protein